MPRRLSIVPVVLASLLASCAIGSGPLSDAACVDPPPSERQRTSALSLTVEPNPVAAGSEATLSLSAEGLPAEVVDGAGAAWQCWTGSEWTSTHQIVRGFGGDPETLLVEPGATTTIPAIGLPIPNSYPILIPEVLPGAYRIEDHVVVSGNTTISGFILVEVR